MRNIVASAIMVAMLALPQSAAFAATLDQAKSFVTDVGANALLVIKDGKNNKRKKKKNLSSYFLTV